MWDPSGEASAALKWAVETYGPAVLSNPQMLSNFLQDVLPDSPREASLLVAAADSDTASLLRQHVGERMDVDSAVRLTAAGLGERRAIEGTAGLWVATE